MPCVNGSCGCGGTATLDLDEIRAKYPNGNEPDDVTKAEVATAMVTPAQFRYPADREDLSEFAVKFFAECMQIAREKNLRYAGDTDPFKNFRLGGTYGIAIRMTDKVSRLLTLTEPGSQIDGADESVEDTCRDLANYAMLLSAMRSNERS